MVGLMTMRMGVLLACVHAQERPEVWPTEVIPHKTEKKPAATGGMPMCTKHTKANKSAMP
eukprot:5538035-Amphidinium_carterae.1